MHLSKYSKCHKNTRHPEETGGGKALQSCFQYNWKFLQPKFKILKSQKVIKVPGAHRKRYVTRNSELQTSIYKNTRRSEKFNGSLKNIFRRKYFIEN